MRYLTFIIAVIILATSCEVLDVEPTDKIDADLAIVDESSLSAAVNGAYDQLQSVGFAEDAIIFADLAADNWIHVGSKKEYAQVDDNQLVSSNAYIEGIWNSCYDGINRINSILAKEPELTNVSPAKLDHYMGQCYFMRALNYFTLAKYFGGVPLRLTPTTGASPDDVNIARANITDTYQQIIDDLEVAETRLANSPVESAFANVYAAKALLARVYLYFSEYENHWTDAANKALEVIESREFTLTDSTNFKNLYIEGEQPDEIIFQVDFFKDDDQNAIASWTRPEGRLEVTAWKSKDKVESIYHEYDENDFRRDVTVEQDGDEYYSNKYTDVGNSKDNVIIIRLAEMYLIRAEALNENGFVANSEAFRLLNKVRRRVGIDTLTTGDAPGQSYFRLAIERERQLEFAFEGHRFFDLKRTGRIDDVLPLTGNMDENNWLFPIPQSEMDTNELMEQNGSY